MAWPEKSLSVRLCVPALNVVRPDQNLEIFKVKTMVCIDLL